MSIDPQSLPADQQSLISREMARGEYSSPDDLLRDALQYWGDHRETVAALEEAIDEMDAGGGQPLEDFEREFRIRHGLPLHEQGRTVSSFNRARPAMPTSSSSGF